jgi:tetratricopeptide (TPR) repeat protein
MNARSPLTWLLACLFVLGFAGAWRLQRSIDAQRAAIYLERDELMLRSGKTVKAMSLEYAPLMADIYWTRAVQYYGNKRSRRDANLELLWPFLDVATTLDPHLLVAYRFGSTFLSEAAPRGAGRPDLAIQLLERGIKANPGYWRFYQDLGYVYYFDRKDYTKASQAFLEGSKYPDSYIWMKIMAAKIAAEGESFDTSVFLWKEVYDTTTDPAMKKNAETHLKLLKVQIDCKQIDALSDEFEKRAGRRPARMGELVQTGLFRGVPVDPDGYPYVLDKDGKAEVNLNSPMLEEELMNQNNP